MWMSSLTNGQKRMDNCPLKQNWCNWLRNPEKMVKCEGIETLISGNVWVIKSTNEISWLITD